MRRRPYRSRPLLTIRGFVVVLAAVAFAGMIGFLAARAFPGALE